MDLDERQIEATVRRVAAIKRIHEEAKALYSLDDAESDLVMFLMAEFGAYNGVPPRAAAKAFSAAAYIIETSLDRLAAMNKAEQ